MKSLFELYLRTLYSNNMLRSEDAITTKLAVRQFKESEYLSVWISFLDELRRTLEKEATHASSDTDFAGASSRQEL